MNKIQEIINELKKYIYYNKIENSDFDKVNIQKNLYKLLRECIKNKVYEIEIGSYKLNIKPDELSVKYETENTLVEVSKDDVHIENVSETNIEYFVIAPAESEEYSITIPAIMVEGVISTYDNTYEEIYEITISEDIEDNIRNYINLNNRFEYASNEFDNKYSVIIKRNITSETKYTNIYDIFNKKIVKPVTYNKNKDNYVRRTISYESKTYASIIPTLEDKKLITSYLYGLIVEFYTEYVNNNI